MQLEIGMPSAQQRESILKLILRRAVAESNSIQGALRVDNTLATVNKLILVYAMYRTYQKFCDFIVSDSALVSAESGDG